MNGDGRNLPCPVCKGKNEHHRNCPVPVLGPPPADTGSEQ